MSNESSSNSGIGTLGLLGVAFIVLKLCNVITWSWWWVTSPLWVGFALVILGLIIYGIWYLFIRRNKSDVTLIKRKPNFQERLKEMSDKRK